MIDVEKYRREFPVTNNYDYLNHAGHSPACKRVHDTIIKCTDELMESGDYTVNVRETKDTFAKLVGAKIDEIAVVTNTTIGLNTIVNMLEIKSGKNIVTNDLEYPSNVYPWLKMRSKGIEVRYAKNINGKIPIETYERIIDDNTLAVAVSHVTWTTGFKHDLKELAKIAHRHGAYLIVDAIQAAGAIKVNVREMDIDFLSCGTYKWLLGPTGAGYLYIKEEHIDKFTPPYVGYIGVKYKEDPLEFDLYKLEWKENAEKFELGTMSHISFVGAQAAIELILEVKIENIEERIMKLTRYLIEKLLDQGFKLQNPINDKERGGIVNFKLKNGNEICKKLRKENIITSFRAGGLRVSPHFYNTREEIDLLIEKLKKLTK